MKFYAIGGFKEVGKNMTALEVKGEVVIFDMGVSMEHLIELSARGLNYEDLDEQTLRNFGVLPNDIVLAGKKVIGIAISHGHLDHISALPKLAKKYKCPILATPYTAEIIKRLFKDHKQENMLKYINTMQYGDTAELSKNFRIEYVNMTHSIPDSSLIAVYTSEGLVTVGFDFKLDNTPTLGEKPDYKRLKELGNEGIKLHLSECVHIRDEQRTPSEKVAKDMVFDAIDRAYLQSSAVFITSFASHIARIKSIIEANKGRREIMIFGRSMDNYINAAKTLGMIDTSEFKLLGRPKEIKPVMENLKRDREKYLILCTGNQGEPNSVLSRITHNEYKFAFNKEDQVIFSSKVIPTPINKANRYVVERDLKEQGVRILKDVHVSGHAMREDHRDLLRILNPQKVIPVHGETERLASFASLCEEEGYTIGDTVNIMTDGRYLNIK
ncbi:MAG: RNase J family beta-CASP ribonuclease [archaeon]|nr:RNase J family beta-CASP ribonuclease [archaeon]